MKTFKDIINEVAQPKGGDEKSFKAKHVIQKINHPAAKEGQFTGEPSVKKDKSKKASYEDGEDEAVYEETDKEDDMCPECGESYDECECDGEEMEEAKMSDADMKQRENIVKGMKKSKADLQARYGDKWKSVMYATATKKAMEAVELDEAVNVKAIQKAVDDGKSMDVIMTMFANKKTTNTDEIRKVVKDHMWNKRTKKESVELDEISSDLAKRYTKAAKMDRDFNDDDIKRLSKSGQSTQAMHRKNSLRTKGINRAANKMEAVELDEARSLAKKDGYEFFNNDKDESVEVKYKNKIISTGDFDRGADGWFLNIKGQRGQKFFREPVDVVNFFSKNNIRESVELDEAFKAGEMKLSDGSSVKLTNEDVSALNTLFKELNSANQKKMQERMMKDKKGFAEIVSFAKEAL